MRMEFERCIVCLSDGPITREHILPRALGGRLTAWCLCKRCNSRFGQELVPRLLGDPSVILAVEAVRKRVPTFYQERTSGQVYVGKNPDGSAVRVKVKNGRPKVVKGEGSQGSEIWDTEDYLKHRLAPELSKSGISQEALGETLQQIRELPTGVCLPLPFGKSIIKHPLPNELDPSLKGARLVDPRMVALLAYEWLAVSCAGDQIFQDCFGAVRSFIQGPEPDFSPDYDLEDLEICRLGGKDYRPAHDLYTISRKDGLFVYIRLFGWLVFRVNFKKIRYPYRRALPVYREDLELGEGLAATSLRAARNGNFRILFPAKAS